MPTWRGKSFENASIDEYKEELLKHLYIIDKKLSNKEMMFIKLHQIVINRIDLPAFKNIRIFPEGIDTYEFLSIADILISDYSSVMIDFAITNKPIIMFTYDYDEYLSERGFYLDINQLPFPRANTANELIEQIKTFTEPDYSSIYEKFLKNESINTIENIFEIIFNENTTIDTKKKTNTYNLSFISLLRSDIDNTLKIINDSLKNTVFIVDQKNIEDLAYRTIINNYPNIKLLVVPNGMSLTYIEHVLLKIYQNTGLIKCVALNIYKNELNRIAYGINIGRITNYTNIEKFKMIEKVFKTNIKE